MTATNTTFIVGDGDIAVQDFEVGGDRLDRWLVQRLPEHSRNTIQRWIKDGDVRVNGIPARANYRVTAGDTINATVPNAPLTTTHQPEAIPLTILYEDHDLVVVDKPTGLVVHPAPGHSGGTLVNAILHHIPDLNGIAGELRPGIVHRLDKDTSGVMVVAKDEATLRNLQAQFKNRKVEKRYIALVEGKIDEANGRIVAPIGRDPRNRKRMAVITADKTSATTSRPATTEFEVLGRYSVPLHNDLGRGAFTLVQAHPITGRTHQIRVHFAWRGHPLVGDPIYGLKHQRLQTPRLFLHAARLGFVLPSTGKWIEFVAPLPSDLQEVLVRLEQATR